MNQRFPFDWAITILALLAYFFVGMALVKEAVLSVKVLLLVLVV